MPCVEGTLLTITIPSQEGMQQDPMIECSYKAIHRTAVSVVPDLAFTFPHPDNSD